MNQLQYDNQEAEYTYPSADEMRHQAFADAHMAAIIDRFDSDSSEVLMILSDALRQMAQGELDSRAANVFHSLLDNTMDMPFVKRHEPFNRFIIDTLYAKAVEMAAEELK